MNHAPMPPAAGRVFQLTDASVSITRPAGRDKNGVPREQTICALAKVEKWVDVGGNICDVPLRTTRVLANTSEDEKYEQIIRKNWIAAGGLPLAECPYTTEYARIVNPLRDEKLDDSLIAVPQGARACKGAPGGCEHLQPVIKERLEISAAAHRAQEAVGKTLPIEAVTEMARSLGEGIGASIGTGGGSAAKNARANLRDGRGEQ